MSVSATEAVTPAGMYQPATSPGSTTDKEMFLDLMVAQLRYQDPMNPADSGEFLAQNAQFTALEKMQDVADQTAALLSAQVTFGAAGLVGKNVSYLAEDGTSVSGLVQSVTYDASGPMLVVDGAQVTLGQVTSVDAVAKTPTPAPTPAPTTPAPTTP
ncbi:MULTISPECIES: flagellar hook capping FlgD N-terminal domain-containing protein [unclassified Nocardioides]|uniref:flagellar hook capping FlgD N-terminal domain-containing protein n=1 Tax=unclassified Nocardioides TaxID=2615069 RepID=UPI0009F00537|nr:MULTISPECIES: flagellar hook capping FlgD N-terminal domain-containing protein [unclassified Nocardioides]GAW51219.1 flagellar hook capping protein [Nocardioides sp. PD653-B2]GAW56947.1 flagellar hook capping protein [Nocardioides sp. PD653]